MKAMDDSLVDPGVEDIDYKALQHIIGHGKIVYLRSTRPLYRYPQASIRFQEDGSESSSGGEEIEEMESSSETHAVVQKRSLLSSNSPVTPKKVECPLCYSLFSSDEIELHASICSGDDHDRPDFIDLALQVDGEADDAVDGCEDEVIKEGPREEVAKTYTKEDLMAALELPLSQQRTAGTESIRILRNSAWKDFTNYMQKPWKPSGFKNYRVSFLGEIGIDAGGPKREFFTG